MTDNDGPANSETPPQNNSNRSNCMCNCAGVYTSINSKLECISSEITRIRALLFEMAEEGDDGEAGEWDMDDENQDRENNNARNKRPATGTIGWRVN